MKKIFTLAFMAFFCCLGTMAQITLGDIKFSLREGGKINPVNGKITVTFPNATGVDDLETPFTLAGNFGNEDTAFDGIIGTFDEGAILSLGDFELEPATDYTLSITSVIVNETELAADTTYTLNFKTRSAERQMEWTFTIDEESAAQIVAEGSTNPASDTADVSKYMDIQKNGSTTHRYYVPARNYEEIMLPDGNPLPMTEDLIFKFGNKAFYVGDTEGSYKDLIAFNGKNQYMVIPDCQVGDVITFNANRATKGSASKPTNIVAMNGAAISPDGLESASGLKDSIWLGSSYANYKFEVLAEGDITFLFNNCLMKSLKVEAAQPKVPCKYAVNAIYEDEELNQTLLKALVAETDSVTGSTIKVNYPYWLTDAEGNVYTYGSKGNEFVEKFELEGDTTFVIKYKKTEMTGAVYLSEGEDLTGAVLCTNGNAAIRSSMGKAAYVTEDLVLTKLEAGSYIIKGIIFDAQKTTSYVCTLTKGEGVENEIYLAANATNWTEAKSDLLTITEATDITLKAGGSDNTGLDVILIYKSSEDTEGIETVKNGAQQMAVRKVAKDGRILIETAKGTFNVLGVQVK